MHTCEYVLQEHGGHILQWRAHSIMEKQRTMFYLLKTVYNIIGMSVSKSLLMDLCVGPDRLSVF